MPFRLSLAIVLILCGCRPAPPPKPEGIVLFIADGTSPELLTAARLYSQGGKGRLALEQMPRSAIVRTVSANSLVTDSSAAATAIARGIKADNGVVGVPNASAETGPPSLLDLARQAGWSTGVISDDSVTGATPASFLVEHGRRADNFQIAEKIIPQLGRRADIILGGGSRWFVDMVKDPSVFYFPGHREIARRNEENLRATGADIFLDWETFRNRSAAPSRRPVIGLFAPDVFSYYADGERTLRLRDMVEEAVTFLRAKGAPFLLVVEAGLPDKASHRNNAKRAITEVLELDAAIQWVRENVPGALVLATTDHNTGGLTINGYPPRALRGDALLRPDPVNGRFFLTWASGPGFDRKNIRSRIEREPGKPWREIKEVRLPTDVDFTQPALLEAGSALHSGGDVWLLAAGPGADRVHGFMENTDIFHIAAAVIADKP